MAKAVLCSSIVALSLTCLTSSRATTTLESRLDRQKGTVAKDLGTIRFFHHHRWLLKARKTRGIARHALKFAQAELAWTRREMRETLSLLTASAYPPHHALWMCVHNHEASNWQDPNSGGNGHYGGLQMHPGWGYSTSYYASEDSQLTQEWAAERGFRASGFSRVWLFGQWAHPECMALA